MDCVSANAIDANVVLNMDQSQYEYEITSNRTLSVTGEKTTEATVASVATTTPTSFRSLFSCQDASQRNCTSVFRKQMVNLANVFPKHYNVTNLQI